MLIFYLGEIGYRMEQKSKKLSMFLRRFIGKFVEEFLDLVGSVCVLEV